MGKNSPALFELIRDPGVNQKSMPVAQQTRTAGSAGPQAEPETPAQSPAQNDSAEPADLPVLPRVEPKPRVVLALPKEEPREPEPSAPSPLPPSPPSAAAIRVRRLPQLKLNNTTLSIGAVGVLLAGLVFLVIWATAFRMGQSNAEQEARKKLELAGVRDPLKGDNIPLNPSLIQTTPEPALQAITPPRKPPAAIPLPSKPNTTVPPGSPPDTRQIGLNYCFAASRLSMEQAERAAGFLRENGVRAIAVLEGGSPGSNNPDSWRVVVLQGITAQEFRDRAPVRTTVEADLTRFGETYRRDPKGRVDFGQFAWEKLKD